MGGSSELEVINEIKSVVESLWLWFQTKCMKVNEKLSSKWMKTFLG